MRMMKKAGVDGLFFDHATDANWVGTNFAHLHTYVIYKLWQDIDCDVEGVIKEFTDHRYGPAAPKVRQYLADLEAARKKIKKFSPKYTFKARDYSNNFPYLTPENIYKWQLLFDEMTALPGLTQEHAFNLTVLRRNLDFASLHNWTAVSEARPDYFKDYNVQAGRIAALQKKRKFRGASTKLRDMLFAIKAAERAKPVPEQFKDIPAEQIKRYVPKNYSRKTMRKGPASVEDKDAAFGYAATVHIPQLPFYFGYYKKNIKERTIDIKLESKDIVPGKYKLYKLGLFEITNECMIWFSTKSWQTQLQLADRLYEPGAENMWEAWVSMKFDGPMYGGEGKEDQVLCDQVIFIQKSDL
jgi:hypothetical protein